MVHLGLGQADIYELAVVVLASSLILFGLDDLTPLAIFLWAKRPWAAGRQVAEQRAPGPGRRIAIFVPCWREASVIANMIRHNLAVIRYVNYDFFVGVYPNDGETGDVVEQLARDYRNVHRGECPHPGPTSKADCLNWIYRRMLQVEAINGYHFDTIVLHDAEDMIHPESLAVIDRERARHDMVQVPVLALPTPLSAFTHNLYCDDFAEYQTIDMPAREVSGSFIPSNGVGTGYSRRVLDHFGRVRDGRVFEPASLTEDYESGVRIHQLGLPQTFYSLRRSAADWIATREYFPSTFQAAVRQRTRWVMGIALQGWQQHGWRGPLLLKYWFWRDRKGLLTNPLGLLSNLLSLAGLLDWLFCQIVHVPWHLALHSPAAVALCIVTAGLQMFRLALRMVCVYRIYNASLALTVPVRSFYANLVNSIATARALALFTRAQLAGRQLSWHKTEHAYPQREVLAGGYRSLQEVLVSAGFLTAARLADLLEAKPAEEELGAYLVGRGHLTEEQLCRALSLMAGVPASRIEPHSLKPAVVQALPAHLARRWRLLPFRIEAGRMMVAGSEVPEHAAWDELRRWTGLEVHFHLVTPTNYRELEELLT